MFTIKLMTSTERYERIVDPATTPKDFLLANDVDFSTAAINLDGGQLSTTEMNTSFADLGITDKAIMAVVVKLTNG